MKDVLPTSAWNPAGPAGAGRSAEGFLQRVPKIRRPRFPMSAELTMCPEKENNNYRRGRPGAVCSVVAGRAEAGEADPIPSPQDRQCPGWPNPPDPIVPASLRPGLLTFIRPIAARGLSDPKNPKTG